VLVELLARRSVVAAHTFGVRKEMVWNLNFFIQGNREGPRTVHTLHR